MKIADLTPGKLKDTLREVIEEEFKEFFLDPDYGLELGEGIEKRLTSSLASKERIPLEEVKKRLGVTS